MFVAAQLSELLLKLCNLAFSVRILFCHIFKVFFEKVVFTSNFEFIIFCDFNFFFFLLNDFFESLDLFVLMAALFVHKSVKNTNSQ